MEQRTKKFSLDIRRFNAIKGAEVKSKISGLSDGQLGCLLSHLTLIESNINADSHLLIIEDDEELAESFATLPLIPGYLEREHLGWDIIYLDATIVQPEAMIILFDLVEGTYKEEIKLVEVMEGLQTFGTHAYLVNKLSKEKLAGLIRKYMYQGKPIDNIFVALAHYKELKFMITLPFLAAGSHDTLTSQIGSSQDGRINIWLTIRRHLARLTRSNTTRNDFEDLIRQHRRLFGDGRFGHFIDHHD